jgi:hypothetical protein
MLCALLTHFPPHWFAITHQLAHTALICKHVDVFSITLFHLRVSCLYFHLLLFGQPLFLTHLVSSTLPFGPQFFLFCLSSSMYTMILLLFNIIIIESHACYWLGFLKWIHSCSLSKPYSYVINFLSSKFIDFFG